MTDGPLVTVCVPAYRSERFIGHTLAAIQGQTFSDFRVRIGLEPVDEGPTVDACLPFLTDPRFELVINERQLGWDGNVAALMEQVETPLFAVQPHDDIPRPDYLRDLVGMMASRSDASVAYSDVLSFGGSSGRRPNPLPDVATRSERELGFFLAGAEGHPFRGVTRSTVLARPFSTNAHRGFAVETEWALHLVQQGVALRSRRPLYLKRQHGRTDEASVTIGWRFGMTPDEQAAAMEHNRSRLLEAVGPDEHDGVPRELVLLAAEAAMLRRWSVVPGEPLPFREAQLERVRRVLHATAALASPAARIGPPDIRSTGARMTAMVHVALARHHVATGDDAAGIEAARAAVRCCPTDKEACLLLAQLLLAAGEHDAAIDLITQAAEGAPLDDGVLRLIEVATRAVAQRYPALVPPAPDPAVAQGASGTPR